MDGPNLSTTEISAQVKNNGRTFVLSLIVVILVFIALVIIRCVLEYQKQKKYLRRNEAIVFKRQKFKEELETAVKNRRDRLKLQESQCSTDKQRNASNSCDGDPNAIQEASDNMASV